jgi:hypothetical protein
LEEAILRSDHALGKEEIVLALRVDVGHSPAIAQNVHGPLQSWYSEFAGDDGQGLMGGADEIRFLAGLSESAKWNQQDEQANAFHGRPIVMLDGKWASCPPQPGFAGLDGRGTWLYSSKLRARKLPNELNWQIANASSGNRRSWANCELSFCGISTSRSTKTW